MYNWIWGPYAFKWSINIQNNCKVYCFCTGCLSVVMHLVNLSSQEVDSVQMWFNDVSEPICRRWWLRWWLLLVSFMNIRDNQIIIITEKTWPHIVHSLVVISPTISDDNYDSYKLFRGMITQTWGMKTRPCGHSIYTKCMNVFISFSFSRAQIKKESNVKLPMNFVSSFHLFTLTINCFLGACRHLFWPRDAFSGSEK